MDYSESARFYKISADMGVTHSQLQYGLALYIGRGVEKNGEQAIEYIKKSAKGGNESAKRMLSLPEIPSKLLLDMIDTTLRKCKSEEC